ncbi:MAG: hypothetical protein PUD25_01940 [Bacilli bacterium]|nr:hypothetical protein [Bacilli bacterium]
MENKNLEEQDYIDILKNVQQEFPNIIIPSMGLIQNQNQVHIDGKKIFNDKESKESNHVE